MGHRATFVEPPTEPAIAPASEAPTLVEKPRPKSRAVSEELPVLHPADVLLLDPPMPYVRTSDLHLDPPAACRDRRPTPADLLRAATAKERAGDFEGAIHALEHALDIAPDPACVNRLAIICARLEQFDRAIGLLRYAISVDPENPVSRSNLRQVEAAARKMRELTLERFYSVRRFSGKWKFGT